MFVPYFFSLLRVWLQGIFLQPSSMLARLEGTGGALTDILLCYINLSVFISLLTNDVQGVRVGSSKCA